MHVLQSRWSDAALLTFYCHCWLCAWLIMTHQWLNIVSRYKMTPFFSFSCTQTFALRHCWQFKLANHSQRVVIEWVKRARRSVQCQHSSLMYWPQTTVKVQWENKGVLVWGQYIRGLHWHLTDRPKWSNCVNATELKKKKNPQKWAYQGLKDSSWRKVTSLLPHELKWSFWCQIKMCRI